MNDKDIDALLAQSLNDGESDIALAERTNVALTDIRRRESQTGIILKRFPKVAKSLPYDKLYKLFVEEEMPVAAIVDSLGVGKNAVASAIRYYGMVLSDDAKVRMRRKAYDIARAKYRAQLDDPEIGRKIREKRIKTSMEHYGVPNPQQSQSVRSKTNKTLERKYGKGGSPFANKSVRDKAKRTMRERHGTDWSWQAEDIKEKIRRTNKERYGVDNPMQNEKIRAKASRTNVERYGVKWNTESPEARAKAIESYMNHYGVDNPSKAPEVLDKIAKSMQRGESVGEKKVSALLDSLGVEYETNNHSIIGQELDFVIPSTHVAIEVSPVFTHNSNEEQVLTVKPKKRGYHKHKHDMALKKGYELITLFDDSLMDVRWENLTVPFLTMKATGHTKKAIYARQTTINHETTKAGRHECIAFIERNHFNGNTPAKEYFSVRDSNGDMVGTFSLRHPIGRPDDVIELARLVWAPDLQVRYGLSKIVAMIAKTMTEKTLLSFSNNNIGNGRSYSASGFTLDGEVAPALHFMNPHDPMDSYSWQVATTWGAKSGVIARLLHPMTVTKREAKRIVETELPHRTDGGRGYFSYYDSGSRRWMRDLDALR